MKELLLQYAKYNIWANKRIIDTLLKLDELQPDLEIASSFPSIRKTVYHVWSAEQIWLDRLQLVENPVWAESKFNGNWQEACHHWLQTSESLLAFANKQFNDQALAHVVQYYSLQKKSFKTPVFTVLQHAFNHSTYHRGQLVTMLRHAGVQKIPNTDLITFSREKK